MDQQKVIANQESGRKNDQVIQMKKNDQGIQMKKSQQQKEEFFTITWGCADQVPSINLSPNKNRLLSHLNNSASPISLNSQFNQEKPKITQINNPYKQVQNPYKQVQNSYKQFQKSHQIHKTNSPLYALEYFPSEAQSLNSFNQKPFASQSIFFQQMIISPNFIKRDPFTGQASIKRTHVIPSQFSHLLAKRNASQYAQQQNSRMSSSPWSDQVPEINQENPNPIQDNIRLNIRSQLIRRSRKYQISTNNAHKKYINCLKNLFYQALSQQQITEFERKYIKQKSSRVFFFIILVYVKYRFTKELGNAVKEGFEKQMKERVREYEEKAYRCSDLCLKNYRIEQIHQIQIAIRAIEQFFVGNTPQAIEYLYRKDKRIIVKQNHFRTSLKIIQDLETQYSSIQGQKISQPFFKDHYHRKIKNISMQENAEKELHFLNNYQKQQIAHNNQKEQSSREGMQYEVQIPVSQSDHGVSNASGNHISLKEQRIQNEGQIYDQINQIEAENNEPVHNGTVLPQNLNIESSQHQGPSNQGSELPLQELQSKTNLRLPQNPFNKLPSRQSPQQLKDLEEMEQILFPPIPPYFYLPDFDQNYGYLFRKLTYVKSWRQMNQNQRFSEQYSHKNDPKYGNRMMTPSPLSFGKDSLFSMKKN